MKDPIIWALSNGKPGMENQCLGLIEALGATPVIKRIDLAAPFKWLPPHICPATLAALAPGSDPLTPPWPDLLVACGRIAIAPARAVRRLSGGHTRLIQIQDPRAHRGDFDLIVTPAHDRLRGANVLNTIGSVHRLTQEKLRRRRRDTAAAFARLPRPLIVVMAGGPNKVYAFGENEVTRLLSGLKQAVQESGGTVLATASRRTPPDCAARLRKGVEALGGIFWDGGGDNPYPDWLAQGDHFIVTADSVNMICEAAATGKPVHVLELPGRGGKFARFHEQMRRRGATRPFRGKLDRWQYEPVNENARIAAEVRKRLGLPEFTSLQGR